MEVLWIGAATDQDVHLPLRENTFETASHDVDYRQSLGLMYWRFLLSCDTASAPLGRYRVARMDRYSITQTSHDCATVGEMGWVGGGTGRGANE